MQKYYLRMEIDFAWQIKTGSFKTNPRTHPPSHTSPFELGPFIVVQIFWGEYGHVKIRNS